MTAFRWWLFKRLLNLAWIICPDPQESKMKDTWVAIRDQWLAEMRRLAREEKGDGGAQ
jgi:hypothetical protein